MKKFMSILLVLAMALALVACGSSNTPAATTVAATEASADGETAATEAAEASAEAENALIDADGNPFHVGIVTGSVSQSEDDRRGAEAFQRTSPWRSTPTTSPKSWRPPFRPLSTSPMTPR